MAEEVDTRELVPFRIWFPPNRAPKKPGEYIIIGEWQFSKERGPEFIVDAVKEVRDG